MELSWRITILVQLFILSQIKATDIFEDVDRRLKNLDPSERETELGNFLTNVQRASNDLKWIDNTADKLETNQANGHLQYPHKVHMRQSRIGHQNAPIREFPMHANKHRLYRASNRRLLSIDYNEEDDTNYNKPAIRMRKHRKRDDNRKKTDNRDQENGEGENQWNLFQGGSNEYDETNKIYVPNKTNTNEKVDPTRAKSVEFGMMNERNGYRNFKTRSHRSVNHDHMRKIKKPSEKDSLKRTSMIKQKRAANSNKHRVPKLNFNKNLPLYHINEPAKKGYSDSDLEENNLDESYEDTENYRRRRRNVNEKIYDELGNYSAIEEVQNGWSGLHNIEGERGKPNEAYFGKYSNDNEDARKHSKTKNKRALEKCGDDTNEETTEQTMSEPTTSCNAEPATEVTTEATTEYNIQEETSDVCKHDHFPTGEEDADAVTEATNTTSEMCNDESSQPTVDSKNESEPSNDSCLNEPTERTTEQHTTESDILDLCKSHNASTKSTTESGSDSEASCDNKHSKTSTTTEVCTEATTEVKPNSESCLKHDHSTSKVDKLKESSLTKKDFDKLNTHPLKNKLFKLQKYQNSNIHEKKSKKKLTDDKKKEDNLISETEEFSKKKLTNERNEKKKDVKYNLDLKEGTNELYDTYQNGRSMKYFNRKDVKRSIVAADNQKADNYVIPNFNNYYYNQNFGAPGATEVKNNVENPYGIMQATKNNDAQYPNEYTYSNNFQNQPPLNTYFNAQSNYPANNNYGNELKNFPYLKNSDVAFYNNFLYNSENCKDLDNVENSYMLGKDAPQTNNSVPPNVLSDEINNQIINDVLEKMVNDNYLIDAGFPESINEKNNEANFETKKLKNLKLHKKHKPKNHEDNDGSGYNKNKGARDEDDNDDINWEVVNGRLTYKKPYLNKHVIFDDNKDTLKKHESNDIRNHFQNHISREKFKSRQLSSDNNPAEEEDIRDLLSIEGENDLQPPINETTEGKGNMEMLDNVTKRAIIKKFKNYDKLLYYYLLMAIKYRMDMGETVPEIAVTFAIFDIVKTCEKDSDDKTIAAMLGKYFPGGANKTEPKTEQNCVRQNNENPVKRQQEDSDPSTNSTSSDMQPNSILNKLKELNDKLYVQLNTVLKSKAGDEKIDAHCMELIVFDMLKLSCEHIKLLDENIKEIISKNMMICTKNSQLNTLIDNSETRQKDEAALKNIVHMKIMKKFKHYDKFLYYQLLTNLKLINATGVPRIYIPLSIFNILKKNQNGGIKNSDIGHILKANLNYLRNYKGLSDSSGVENEDVEIKLLLEKLKCIDNDIFLKLEISLKRCVTTEQPIRPCMLSAIIFDLLEIREEIHIQQSDVDDIVEEYFGKTTQNVEETSEAILLVKIEPRKKNSTKNSDFLKNDCDGKATEDSSEKVIVVNIDPREMDPIANSTAVLTDSEKRTMKGKLNSKIISNNKYMNQIRSLEQKPHMRKLNSKLKGKSEVVQNNYDNSPLSSEITVNNSRLQTIIDADEPIVSDILTVSDNGEAVPLDINYDSNRNIDIFESPYKSNKEINRRSVIAERSVNYINASLDPEVLNSNEKIGKDDNSELVVREMDKNSLRNLYNNASNIYFEMVPPNELEITGILNAHKNLFKFLSKQEAKNNMNYANNYNYAHSFAPSKYAVTNSTMAPSTNIHLDGKYLTPYNKPHARTTTAYTVPIDVYDEGEYNQRNKLSYLSFKVPQLFKNSIDNSMKSTNELSDSEGKFTTRDSNNRMKYQNNYNNSLHPAQAENQRKTEMEHLKNVEKSLDQSLDMANMKLIGDKINEIKNNIRESRTEDSGSQVPVENECSQNGNDSNKSISDISISFEKIVIADSPCNNNHDTSTNPPVLINGKSITDINLNNFKNNYGVDKSNHIPGRKLQWIQYEDDDIIFDNDFDYDNYIRKREAEETTIDPSNHYRDNNFPIEDDQSYYNSIIENDNGYSRENENIVEKSNNEKREDKVIDFNEIMENKLDENSNAEGRSHEKKARNMGHVETKSIKEALKNFFAINATNDSPGSSTAAPPAANGSAANVSATLSPIVNVTEKKISEKLKADLAVLNKDIQEVEQERSSFAEFTVSSTPSLITVSSVHSLVNNFSSTNAASSMNLTQPISSFASTVSIDSSTVADSANNFSSASTVGLSSSSSLRNISAVSNISSTKFFSTTEEMYMNDLTNKNEVGKSTSYLYSSVMINSTTTENIHDKVKNILHDINYNGNISSILPENTLKLPTIDKVAGNNDNDFTASVEHGKDKEVSNVILNNHQNLQKIGNENDKDDEDMEKKDFVHVRSNNGNNVFMVGQSNNTNENVAHNHKQEFHKKSHATLKHKKNADNVMKEKNHVKYIIKKNDNKNIRKREVHYNRDMHSKTNDQNNNRKLYLTNHENHYNNHVRDTKANHHKPNQVLVDRAKRKKLYKRYNLTYMYPTKAELPLTKAADIVPSSGSNNNINSRESIAALNNMNNNEMNYLGKNIPAYNTINSANSAPRIVSVTPRINMNRVHLIENNIQPVNTIDRSTLQKLNQFQDSFDKNSTNKLNVVPQSNPIVLKAQKIPLEKLIPLPKLNDAIRAKLVSNQIENIGSAESDESRPKYGCYHPSNNNNNNTSTGVKEMNNGPLERNHPDNEEQLPEAMTGGLASRVVDAAMMRARTDPRLSGTITSGLKREHLPQISNTYFQKQTQTVLKSTEQMLSQIMSALNKVVDQQINTRLCLTLPRDLGVFLAWMTNHHPKLDEPDVQEITLDGSLISPIKETLNITANQDTYLFDQNHSNMGYDKGDIEKRINILKKLIQQYDRLSRTEQANVEEVHEYLVQQTQRLMRISREMDRRTNGKINSVNAIHLGVDDDIAALNFDMQPEALHAGQHKKNGGSGVGHHKTHHNQYYNQSRIHFNPTVKSKLIDAEEQVLINKELEMLGLGDDDFETSTVLLPNYKTYKNPNVLKYNTMINNNTNYYKPVQLKHNIKEFFASPNDFYDDLGSRFYNNRRHKYKRSYNDVMPHKKYRKIYRDDEIWNDEKEKDGRRKRNISDEYKKLAETAQMYREKRDTKKKRKGLNKKDTMINRKEDSLKYPSLGERENSFDNELQLREEMRDIEQQKLGFADSSLLVFRK